jgi:hypothetical protein
MRAILILALCSSCVAANVVQHRTPNADAWAVDVAAFGAGVALQADATSDPHAYKATQDLVGLAIMTAVIAADGLASFWLEPPP